MFARKFLAVLTAATALPAIHAGNVFVVPQNNNNTANVKVSVYSSDTFTPTYAFDSPTPVAMFTTPTGSKHYALTTGGADTLREDWRRCTDGEGGPTSVDI